MTDYALIPHPGSPLASVDAVVAAVEPARSGSRLRFTYRLTGKLDALAVPARLPARRADRLWEHTCFEAFIAPGFGERYCELNFSPSSEWAAYEFDAYRQGMRPLAFTTPPAIAVIEAERDLHVTADVELPALVGAPSQWRIGLAAVVEDRAGSLAYFALQHSCEKPDFHDSAAFMVTLEGEC